MDVLIEKARAGDVAAFEELIAAHQQKIYNLAYRLTGNYHDANDLAQDAIIRIYRALPNYRGDAAFYSWAYSIVTNLYRDMLRKNSRKREEYLDNPMQLADDTIERQVGCEEYDPSLVYGEKEKSEYLQNLIKQLPLEYREVLVYREFMGYSYQEIADLFDVALGTVKSRINRGRKMLQEQIIADGYLNLPHTQESGKQKTAGRDFSVKKQEQILATQRHNEQRGDRNE